MRADEFFDELAARYGDDPRAVGWGSTESQERRFAVIAEIGDLANTSLLDVGCGKGDLRHFLQRLGLNVRYTGWDVSARLIEFARRHHPDTTFEICDVRTRTEEAAFDWVVSSGAFNLETGTNDQDLGKILCKLFSLCRRGAAVNLLSSYNANPRPKPGFHFYCPEAILGMALKISRRAVLRHDYMPHDFTVVMYRDT